MFDIEENSRQLEKKALDYGKFIDSLTHKHSRRGVLSVDFGDGVIGVELSPTDPSNFDPEKDIHWLLSDSKKKFDDVDELMLSFEKEFCEFLMLTKGNVYWQRFPEILRHYDKTANDLQYSLIAKVCAEYDVPGEVN